jgi:hypothetical protein
MEWKGSRMEGLELQHSWLGPRFLKSSGVSQSHKEDRLLPGSYVPEIIAQSECSAATALVTNRWPELPGSSRPLECGLWPLPGSSLQVEVIVSISGFSFALESPFYTIFIVAQQSGHGCMCGRYVAWQRDTSAKTVALAQEPRVGTPGRLVARITVGTCLHCSVSSAFE